MRLLFISVLLLAGSAVYAQKGCLQNSRLYYFNKADEPRLFTDPLGRHPQFPFLQRVNGVTTSEAFIRNIRDTAQRRRYTRTFAAFDLLLHNSGFKRGYKDLNTKNVRKVYITPGTIGNLGFFDPKTNIMNYLYVKLNPAGESEDGVEAWKLINDEGCFLYILFTCGNAFYPNGNAALVINPAPGKGGRPGAGVGVGVVGGGANGSGANGACCKTLTVTAATPMAQTKDSIQRTAILRINHYGAHRISSHTKGKFYDTTYELIRYKDTILKFKDRLVVPLTVDGPNGSKTYTICRDSSIQLPMTADLQKQTDSTQPLWYVLSDTLFEKKPEPKKEESECDNGWAVSIEAGNSWNSVPRLDDPVQHTQTNGSQFTATLEVSKIIAPWFQVGLRASYITISYQDDVVYPGYVPGTYNTVYLAKPMIPIQLFGKFNFGKQIGFQSSVSIGIGYSIPTNGKIENVSGTVLTTNPNLKGDFTASLKFGVAYYFTCHIGVGASFTGEYFNNKSDLIAYSLYALPVQGGLYFRF